VQVVITEAELKRFTGVDELLIPDDAVVTPTAWDYARNYDIRLVRSGVSHKVASRAAYYREHAYPAYPMYPVHPAPNKGMAGLWSRPVDTCASRDGECSPIRSSLYITIERILEVAVARLGSSVEPEVLVTIVIRTLTRLGYDVVISKGGEPG